MLQIKHVLKQQPRKLKLPDSLLTKHFEEPAFIAGFLLSIMFEFRECGKALTFVFNRKIQIVANFLNLILLNDCMKILG